MEQSLNTSKAKEKDTRAAVETRKNNLETWYMSECEAKETRKTENCSKANVK